MMAAKWSSAAQLFSQIVHASSSETILQICTLINDGKEDILSGNDEFEEFFSSVVALSAHFIGLYASSSVACLSQALDACEVIFKFCLALIEKEKVKMFSRKHLISIIEGLCKGHGSLSQIEVSTFMAAFRHATHPSVTCQETSQVDEAKLQVTFYQTMMETFDDMSFPRRAFAKFPMRDFDDEHILDIKSHFSNENISKLREMNGGKVLLDLCASLPSISQFMVLRGLEDSLPPSMKTIDKLTSSAMSAFSTNRVTELASEINLICSIVSIPVMEPLNSYRLNKITLLALGCIDVAMFAASGNFGVAGPDDVNKDDTIKQIVSGSLSVVDSVSNTLASSHRAGGHIFQNFNLLVSQCILKGFVSLLKLESVAEMKANYKQANKTRLVGFNVLFVDLTKKLMNLLSSLFEDCSLESGSQDTTSDLPPREMTIEAQVSAGHRIKQLLSLAHVIPQLLTLFTHAYDKAMCLTEFASASAGPAKSANSDTEACSDHSNEDSTDSECMFGELFVIDKHESKSSDENFHDINSVCPPWRSKGTLPTAEMYLDVSKNIMVFLSDYILNQRDEKIRLNVQASFQVVHLNNLACVVQDLDEVKHGAERLSGYLSFTRSLNRYLHILLAGGLLSETQQETLLSQLSLSPDSAKPWPLYIGPKCLSIFARVLLRRQEKCKNVEQGSDDPYCVKIWERLIETLKMKALSNEDTSQDLNVDHLQLFLLVWHNFSKEQREKIVILCIEALVEVSKDDELANKVPLHCYRLLLILDYFVHQYSALPKDLITQVQYNLFKPKLGAQFAYMNDDTMPEQRLLFFQNVEREERPYRVVAAEKNGEQSSFQQRTPRFYGIRPSDGDQGLLEKDGVTNLLAILGQSTVSYENLYTTLTSLLSAGSNCDVLMRLKQLQVVISDAKIVRCMFGLCWRLVVALSPPLAFLRNLHENYFLELQTPKDFVSLLVRLHWQIHLSDPNNHTPVKECLMELAVDESDAMLVIHNVFEYANNLTDVLEETNGYLQQILDDFTCRDGNRVTEEVLPGLVSVLVLDCVFNRVNVLLRKKLAHSAPDEAVHNELQNMLPLCLDFMKAYQTFSRVSILFNRGSEANGTENEEVRNLEELSMFSQVIKIGSVALGKLPVTSSVSVLAGLPLTIQKSVEMWNSHAPVEFLPTIFPPEHVLNEGFAESPRFVHHLLSAHMKVMSFRFQFNLDASIRHVMHSLVQVTSFILRKGIRKESIEGFREKFDDTIVPMSTDASVDYISEQMYAILVCVYAFNETDEFAIKIQQYLLESCHELMIEHCLTVSRPCLLEDVLVECERLLESLLDKPHGRTTLLKFYLGNTKLINLFLFSAKENLSLSYVHRMLKLMSRIIELCEKEPSLLPLVKCISMFDQASPASVTVWIGRIIIGEDTDKEMTGKMADNRLLLQSIVTSLAKGESLISAEAVNALLECIMPLGSHLINLAIKDQMVIGSKFVDLLSIATTLAGFGDGRGHVKLMDSVIGWLQMCKSNINTELISKSKENGLVECTNVLLNHVADVLAILKLSSDEDEISLSTHGEDTFVSDAESDGVEDDDESGAEESEEDSEGNQLCNKLCTFTATRKEFANQHWYHCHTCRMNDGVGVCTVCAKVCHKNHDVTYAKYGSFFCDCGAKEDDSCRAMKKRNPNESSDAISPDEKISSVSCYRRMQREKDSNSSENKARDKELNVDSSYEMDQRLHKRALRRHLEVNRKALLQLISDRKMCQTVFSLLNSLMTSFDGCDQANSVIGGAKKRIGTALNDLHTLEKTVENNEMLLSPNLGSQEGAFENVKFVCSGEQGQVIRQLLNGHVLRRVAMCCLTSAKGRRQHLAVSHEKGKITILQLSSLLKQADSSRRKLTLTRLATTQVPFTILTLSGNPCNEEFLAVCGLKDCHVLSLSGSGTVGNHLALHPQLEAGNFIIKAVWLPGSQTELAIVTADFVKIYDLSKDALSPVYFFVLPAGKVRDVTFIVQSGFRLMAMMSSGGQIYVQVLDESSCAKSGPFYLTNIVPVVNPELVDINGQVAGGGASIYYSHSFQMLFFSYVQGKTFVAPCSENFTKIEKVFSINVKTATNGTKTAPATLCQWSEVPQHPGLILCSTYTTCAPVVLMVKPDNISFQELKSASSKSKIQDVVAIRHCLSSSDQSRTTVILLCEDGSLKIYMTSQEQSGFWLSPSFQPTSAIAVLKPIKQRKLKKCVRKSSSSPHFPMDFFEHCQTLNDVEYGGKDFLEVYNVQQVKHRLMTAGMYIACTKQHSFSVTITNCNSSVVMVGVRVLVGCQAVDKAPTFLEVFGRVIDVEVKRNRWFDIPFTREETLATDRTITLTLGQSHDAAGVTMVDSIKVYCKSKEVFGWPDDLQDEPPTPAATAATVPTPATLTQSSELLTKTAPLSLQEIMTANSLRALDGFVSLVNAEGETANEEIVHIATTLLSSPLPQQVQEQAKILLSSLHPSKMAYNNHKDEAQLTYVINMLYNQAQESGSSEDMEMEVFERIVVMTRAVAVNRPENLVRFANELVQKHGHSAADSKNGLGESGTFPEKIVAMFWRLYNEQPSNHSTVTVANTGMHHAEMIVFALVEILHAFILSDTVYVPVVVDLYMQLLLSPDVAVSFSCKQALVQLLRPAMRRSQPEPPSNVEETSVYVPTEEPPSLQVETPPASGCGGEELAEVSDQQEQVEVPGNLNAEQPDPPRGAAANRLESLLSGGFPTVYELPPDADDEAMIELAIALSLQEQGEEAALDLHHLLGDAIENGEPVGEGEPSSSSASGHASDDELEHASSSMDVLQIRDSPQPANLQADLGSVSEGSNESISGENQDRQDEAMESGVCATPKPDKQSEMFDMSKYGDDDYVEKLHNLNLLILAEFVEHFPKLNKNNGVQAIPYMQVLLVLCSDLDLNEKDQKLLDRVLAMSVNALDLETKDVSSIAERSSAHEVQLVVMRFLSVLMSKSKFSKSCTPSQVASCLWQQNIMDHCLHILTRLMQHWKQLEKRDESDRVVNVSLLKPQIAQPPDMSPFFLRQYVKSHANDIFEAYPLLVTEMVLRLTYQVKKIFDNSAEASTEQQQRDLSPDWFTCLFEYMMIQQSSFVKIKRQVRKLLLFLCGSKENYREQRDVHALHVHFKAVRRICDGSGYDTGHASATPVALEYETLLEVIEHLKAAAEIASTRTKNWQTYCLQHKYTLPFLFKVSFIIDEGVTSVILQLLTTALCQNEVNAQAEKSQPEPGDQSVFNELVQQLNQVVNIDSVRQFVRCFLLQSNSTSIRWQAHSLLHSIQRNSDNSKQDEISDMMWSIWPELPGFGRKAAQFVDLLGYFTIKRSLSEEKASEFSKKAVCLLKKQNEILRNHPNSNVYRLLSGLVDFDGFYLESDPCLVCNNPEVPYSINKLSAIKADARFSTTSQMVKLISSHNISRVALRVSDVKRQKMVKTINLYYNNRSVQSVVELKNKSSVWQKAKTCHLIQGQTDLKIDFPLPIVACNLMIEYADFYENIQASSETLQCPRCSAAVAASPGVCGNCGENVYQCHKCRSINYDEKDPFLCNACGFCKYAKFDLTLTARACCAVDPIENEEDRKKAVTNINALLERADKMYRQLVAHRQPLDSLLMKIVEQGGNDGARDEPPRTVPVTAAAVVSGSSSSSNTSHQTVNKTIQAVAQRYCVDCKSNFDELSKIIQKVLASRKELLDYDSRVRESCALKASRGDQSTTSPGSLSKSTASRSAPGRCYGCSSAATEHCVTLLKALAMKTSTRDTLIKEGLILELVNYTLYQGTSLIRNNVRDLLCLLTRNNPGAAAQLNDILIKRVTDGIVEQSTNPTVASRLSRDMQLLSKTIEMEDCCWEERLRCVTQIFLLSVKHVSPIVVRAVTLPCLVILSQFIAPKPASSKAHMSKGLKDIASVQAKAASMSNLKEWLNKDPDSGYSEWKEKSSKESSMRNIQKEEYEDDEIDGKWLQYVIFSPSCSSLRQIACSVVEAICQISGRKRRIMDLLTSYLEDVGNAGENATEFFNLYFELMKPAKWKCYLASSGVLATIGTLITKEIEYLAELEETSLSSDLSQGYALKRLTELMASFIEHDKIKQDFKGQLVGAVLNGYLSLRRLVVQRTKLVDQSQDLLLHLLEELTSGTESETREFMSICVNTLNRYELDDLRTPVFIFERLCNIIYPEENDIGEFLLTLEKDPQQEDFLQGRMQGNPYRSTDSGMGPLMRDVKNKICTDCDLIALLDDDTGMELLVNSKIISLDLPVKEVYKKIWCAQAEGEPMKIVYRMRGLLGDATEDIVERLDKNNEKDVDNETVYKMANVMSECGGLEALLTRLSSLRDLVRGNQLLEVILKLFNFCVKVKANRTYLANPSLNTLTILLDVLNQLIRGEQVSPTSAGVGTMAEQILSTIEVLLQGADSAMKLVVSGQEEGSQLEMLLDIIKTPYVRSNNGILLSLMRILPFLTFGDEKSMNTLVDHFAPYLNYEKFDKSHSEDELLFVECFCNIADGIENNECGNQLKDIIIDKGVVKHAIDYVEFHTPSTSFSTSNMSESDLWKDFLSRPSLPYILRFLSGMCKGHERSQLAVSQTAVPSIHRLEQVSSEEKVGSLAENLMEALKEHPEAKAKVTAVRRETRKEKKKLAMAMREKQLGALGMSTTEEGKIISKPSAVVQGFEEISNETGLTCCICREGYKYHPNKVLGIYTYTKRCLLDEYELKQRKSQGYTTVSHFNIVHYECHVAAIRLARGRDEWESAALQNSNTKCNGLLPIWGPNVSESAFASCLSRHNNYIQESTSHLEPTFHNTVHDLRLLMQRFAYEKLFNEDSGGGGRQSNFNIVPYMVHMALYVLNTARLRSREEKSVNTFVEEPADTWVTSCYEVNGPLFMTVLSLFTHSLEEWKKRRKYFLNRLVLLAHVRHIAPKGTSKLNDVSLKSYDVYKPVLVFFALVDKLHEILKQPVSATSKNWSQDLAIYLRNNDEKVLKSCEELLNFYENDVLLSTTFLEFCDVTGLLTEINDPEKSFGEIFVSLPA